MKKELISPILSILAMLLLIISRLLTANEMDLLAYGALAIIIASIYHIYKIIESSK